MTGSRPLAEQAVAPEPELTGQVWQTPVITWMKRLQSSEKNPPVKATC